MADVAALKAAYRGETPSNLALGHSAFHAGSVMVRPPADGGSAAVKAIDPEFAVYGPPGLDVGCLFSSYVLAAVYRAVDGTPEEVGRLRAAVSAIWEAYAASMASRGIDAATLDAIGADAAGFAGCEVARTALGFAGVRGLPISDAAAKEKAEATALAVAKRCITGRAQGGIDILLSTFDTLLEAPTQG